MNNQKFDEEQRYLHSLKALPYKIIIHYKVKRGHSSGEIWPCYILSDHC